MPMPGMVPVAVVRNAGSGIAKMQRDLPEMLA